MSDNYPRIWKVTSLIPRGSVASYGQIADLAGLPGRARLVSKALKDAPRELDLPWHRIINAQGKISLPKNSESYREQRERLLMEGVRVRDGKVDMGLYQWQPDLLQLLFELEY